MKDLKRYIVAIILTLFWLGVLIYAIIIEQR